MSHLGEVFASSSSWSSPPTAERGVVAQDAGLTDPVLVHITSEVSETQSEVFEYGPYPWIATGGSLPKKGDSCFVVFASDHTGIALVYPSVMDPAAPPGP